MMLRFAGVVFVSLLSTASLIVAWSAEPGSPADKTAEPARTAELDSTARRSLDEARREAAALHTALHATLQAVHHQYYREDKGLPLPAAVLKDVFEEIEEERQIKLRWLVVEGQAMNTDHKPQNAFETEAVDALKSGKRALERVENGVYRRAGAITLTSHCLKCHVPDRTNTKNRTAGLLISIPVRDH